MKKEPPPVRLPRAAPQPDEGTEVLVRPVDVPPYGAGGGAGGTLDGVLSTRISWADKPFEVRVTAGGEEP